MEYRNARSLTPDDLALDRPTIAIVAYDVGSGWTVQGFVPGVKDERKALRHAIAEDATLDGRIVAGLTLRASDLSIARRTVPPPDPEPPVEVELERLPAPDAQPATP